MPQKILIVDDSNSMRQMIRFTLEEEGYEIEEAVNGQEGTEKLEGFQPDLIITDIHMPEMNGIEFITHTRGHSNLPRLSYSQPNLNSRCRRRERKPELLPGWSNRFLRTC